MQQTTSHRRHATYDSQATRGLFPCRVLKSQRYSGTLRRTWIVSRYPSTKSKASRIVPALCSSHGRSGTSGPPGPACTQPCDTHSHTSPYWYGTKCRSCGSWGCAASSLLRAARCVLHAPRSMLWRGPCRCSARTAASAAHYPGRNRSLTARERRICIMRTAPRHSVPYAARSA